jgi:perosamine synthetase
VLSGQLSQGAEVDALETEFAAALGARHAVAVSSGSAGLELALRAIGIGAGDEVITSPFTFFSSVASILRTGATPVFADIDPVSHNLDPHQVRDAITRRTAAIMPVHLYGRPCDMNALLEVAKLHSLELIEDACQAIGARYLGRSVGTFGVGCFSFYGSKNITCGEGGMITVSGGALAERLRALRSHGATKTYMHRETSSNFRLTDLQATVLRVQLSRLAAITRRRQQIARLYDRLIASNSVICPPSNDGQYESCYHLYTLRIPSGRRALQRRLAAGGVESRVYYPRPAYDQQAWPGPDYQLKNAEQSARQVLSIPMFPALSRSQTELVADLVNGGTM